MLTLRSWSSRRGFSLIEMMIVVVVTGIVLALVTSISVRQQRLFTDIADRTASSSQLREAATILPIDLGAAAASARDIREATDTSIELRGTFASAVVCDTIANGLVLAPAVSGATTYGGSLTAIEVGDTLWLFSPSDSLDEWRPIGVTAIANEVGRHCAPGGPRLDANASVLPRPGLTLASAPLPLSAHIGMPARLTRSMRYSLYRASDGGWYLGQRDWNPGALRFNTTQPVAGPFLSPASGGLRLTYFDSAGTSLATPVADTRSIASIRAALRTQTKHTVGVLAASSAPGKRTDTTTVVIMLHNRR